VAAAERVRDIVEPLLAARDLSLYDIEHAGGQLKVTIDRPGGVDLQSLSEATRLVSRVLDEHDPIPGHYTLEVSSPGLERALRTPAHFAGAVGMSVNVKLHAGAEGDRRVSGVLTEAGDEEITIVADDGEERRVGLDEIERARTVFEWGPAPRPGKSKESLR
jgi:ribosome maturation factor RimP